ncbi:MAG: DNA gyrase subunit A, partial [bacterium]
EKIKEENIANKKAEAEEAKRREKNLIEKGVERAEIVEEMQKAYLDYAMSVIIGRAIPDARDGLKPVHRRILYAMNDLGLSWNRPYKKSARVVGEVLGKYHPHGDMSVYDCITRMVQDFSMRVPLLNGQGNFGSIDGDSPAAMRYTEIRLARIAHDMLIDIEKETVDFIPNFDETLSEPVVLPTRVPNLLVNGSVGIAVGMATNIPPHNLKEVIDATLHLIDNPDATLDDIMLHIHGPDFPTAGYISGIGGIKDAYRTGRGSIKIKSKYSVEVNEKSDREKIIISELPFQVNKAKLVEKIAGLVNDKEIEGISDIRDESDRKGMRIVIELKKNQIAKVIINQLLQKTNLKINFGINMLAIVNKQPKLLNLQEYLFHFIEYRKEVVRRRTHFELTEAKNKAHILEGLKIAIENIDAIVDLIKKSSSPKDANDILVAEFSLTPIQAKAILDMRLQRLTGMEREKIVEDLNELLKIIKNLEDILGNESLLTNVVKKELIDIREQYKEERRTQILLEDDREYTPQDLIQEHEIVVLITHRGYIKTTSLEEYRTQKRGGVGVKGVTTVEEDFVEHIFVTTNHHCISFFSDEGRVYWLNIHEIAQTIRQSKGKPLINLIPIKPEEKIAAAFIFKEFEEDNYLIMATKKGKIKRSSVTVYQTTRGLCAQGSMAIDIEREDKVISVKMSDGEKDIFIATRKGKAIHFEENQLRPIGRKTMGVRGMRLDDDDEVVEMLVTKKEANILTITEKGYGKLSSLSAYRNQSRGGKGIKNIRITEKKGYVVGVKDIYPNNSIMLISSSGKLIWVNTDDIKIRSRNTQGIKLVGLDKEEKVVGVARLAEQYQDK